MDILCPPFLIYFLNNFQLNSRTLNNKVRIITKLIVIKNVISKLYNSTVLKLRDSGNNSFKSPPFCSKNLKLSSKRRSPENG